MCIAYDACSPGILDVYHAKSVIGPGKRFAERWLCMQRYKDVRELRTIFEEFGPLSDINVPINQMNNQPRGFAFVEYKRSTYADA